MTIIITTSPIRSNPSTLLIESIIDTFHYGGPEFLKCPRLIVADGFKLETESIDKRKKHVTEKSAMRSGIVNPSQKLNYEAFKSNLRSKCTSPPPTSPFHNTTLLELPTRHGYGFALKSALQTITTKHVCVIQHDRTFMRPTPISSIIATMNADPSVKYVGILMRSNLLYLEHFCSKYHSELLNSNLSHVKRPSTLLLDKSQYGWNDVVAEDLCKRFSRCGEKYRTLRENYKNSVPYSQFLNQGGEEAQASLIPTLFWYDNIHICLTEHYLNFVFDPKLKLVARGGFVEDKLSPALVQCVRNVGFGEAMDKFGCYLFDDHCGVAFTGHLDGGSFLTEEQREGRKGGWIDENKKETVKKEEAEGEGDGDGDEDGDVDTSSIFGFGL
ncbi:hypothetical protein TrVE_jg1600 [Triparma verrucosa]|uniref:Uncharacterized protein n=1 Tax=Triparma verrucosa TaxID=1606542 RepID=A0A9W7EZK7_9STRA|nr:hypothetical protein TrVE_jg1600 [Triparma verrucosa]